MLEMKMSCHDQSDRVSFVMKKRHDNDVTDHIGMVYVKKDTELS